MKARLLLEDLWREGLEWDEEIGKTLKDRWLAWLSGARKMLYPPPPNFGLGKTLYLLKILPLEQRRLFDLRAVIALIYGNRDPLKHAVCSVPNLRLLGSFGSHE